MSTKKIQYNSVIANLMHNPISNSGFVLYPKVSDCNDTEEINTQAEKDPVYQKESLTSFNSPTNIRRLFITGSGVLTVYYAAPIVNGRPSVTYVEHGYLNQDKPFKIAQNIFSYEQERQAYLDQKTINKNATEPTRYEFTGNVIGVASSPYTCNNIEEIYFDWTALLSVDVAPFFLGIANDRNKLLACANKTTTFSMVKNDACAKMFWQFNNGGVRDIRKRFPRLRAVGLITNLADVIKAKECNFNDKLLSATTNTKELHKTWLELNAELIKASNSVCIISTLDDVKMPNLEFKIKSERFKFDAEVLRPRIQKYLDMLKSAARQQTLSLDKKEDTQKPVEQEVTVMGEFEKGILDLLGKYSEADLRNALMVILSNKGKSEVEALTNNITAKNKQLINKLVYGRI